VLSTIEATLRPGRVRALTEFPQEGQTPSMHKSRLATIVIDDARHLRHELPAHRPSRARIQPAFPLEVHA
jgi:hypothetical protein